MNKSIETRGRKPKRNLDEIISNLTEQEKEDIVRRYLEITKEKDKKKEANKFKETKISIRQQKIHLIIGK